MNKRDILIMWLGQVEGDTILGMCIQNHFETYLKDTDHDRFIKELHSQYCDNPTSFTQAVGVQATQALINYMQ